MYTLQNLSYHNTIKNALIKESNKLSLTIFVFKVTADNKDERLTGSKSTRYTCTECHKTFSQLRNYKYHMSVHRGTKEFATTCPVCGKFFNDKGYLSSHMKIHKYVQNLRIKIYYSLPSIIIFYIFRNRKEYKCNMCPKSFNQRVAYNMHVRIHTGEFQFNIRM